MTEPMPCPPIIPGFEWERLLGVGGLAEVHLFRQQVPERLVAVKVPHPRDNPTIWPEFIREANVMSTVAGHPAIMTLYLVGVMPDDCPYLVLEYCPVNDLGAQARERPLAVARVLDMMIRLCGGVDMLHRAGFVHGDIKPSNIMVTEYENPVLADFGIAAPVGERLVGGRFSSLWAAPEQQTGNAVARPSWDVWALAATAWTFLAGRSPFADPGGDDSVLAVADRARSGRRARLDRPDVPDELLRTLAAALAVDPAARTATAAEVGKGLQAVQRLLRLPVTPMELREAPEADAGPRVVDKNRTLARGITQLAPAPPAPTLAPPAPAPVGGGPVASATARLGVTSSFEDQPAAAATSAVSGDNRPAPVARIALWAGLAAVVCAAIVTAVIFGSGGAITPGPIGPVNPPVDPVGNIPDPVADLNNTVADGQITWSWTHTGDELTYQYTVTNDGADVETKETSTPSATTLLQAGHVMCIRVVAVGNDGRQSAPMDNCVTTTDGPG